MSTMLNHNSKSMFRHSFLAKTFLCFLSMGFSCLYAQNPSLFSNQVTLFSNRAGATVSPLPGQPFDLQPAQAITGLANKTSSALLQLQFDLGEDYYLVENNGLNNNIIELTYTVNLLNTSGTILRSISNQKLTLSRTQPRQLQQVNITTDVYDPLKTASQLAVKAGINIVSLTIKDKTTQATVPLTGAINAQVNNNLRLQAKVIRNYLLDVRDNNGIMVAAPQITPITSTSSRYVNFNWSPPAGVSNFANYEIQILKINNSNTNYAQMSNTVEGVVNWDNALKVETQSYEKQISLAITEGTGFYIWRIRPIGNFYPGGIANVENYGAWSTSPAQGSTVNLNVNAGGQTSQNFSFYVNDVDDNINWIYDRVFSEGDNGAQVKIKEGISYADGLLYPRQNQVFNSANGQTMATQTIPDYTGRAALSTLPVPFSGTPAVGLAGYKVGMVQVQGSTAGSPTLYTSLNFDSDAKASNPDKMDDINTPYSYYSGTTKTNNDMVPSAENIPYSRTLFKNDGTGRVDEQSAPGANHALGTQHTTRILYASPTNEELIAIFGEEAPLAESVIKTTSIDANNVASISYTSKEGMVIATCLLTPNTNDLMSLEKAANNLQVYHNLTGSSVIDGKLVQSKRLSFGISTSVTLSYNIESIQNNWGCMSGNCEYRLRLLITDIKKQAIFASNYFTGLANSGSFSLSGLSFTQVYGATQSLPAISGGGTTTPSITLAAGEYVITKEISSNANSSTNALALSQSDDVALLLQKINELLTTVKNAQDATIYNQTMNTLTTAFQNPAANIATIRTLLDLPAGFTVPANFTLSFTAGSTGAPSTLNVGTGCCGNSSFSIPSPPVNVVAQQLEGLRQAGNTAGLRTAVETEFWNYFASHVQNNFGDDLNTAADKLHIYAPGFTKANIIDMITNMLNSKYYTGQSIEDNGQRYRAKEDSNGDLQYIDAAGNFVSISQRVLITDLSGLNYNYDCARLYECWKNAVLSLYSESLEGESGKMMNKYNEDKGNNSASENLYDDKSNSDDSNWLLNWIISAKARKFNDGSKGNVDASQTAKTYANVPKIFIDCAGYQFAAILDENETVPAEYANSGSSGPFINNKYLSVGAELRNENGTATSISSNCYVLTAGDLKATYPYILKPEWMFKYYVHNFKGDIKLNSTSVPGFPQKYIHNFYRIANTCYELPPSCSPLCGGRLCHYTHKSWSSGQRLNFYKMLLADSYVSMAESPVNEVDDPVTPAPACPAQAQLQTNADTELNNIKTRITKRKYEFVSKLRAALLKANYQIVDCYNPGEPNKVTEAQIEKMADRVVSNLLTQAETIRPNIWALAGGYPKCETISCYNINNTSYTCVLSSYLKTSLFSPADLTLIKQLTEWYFNPVIDCNAPLPTDGTPKVTVQN